MWVLLWWKRDEASVRAVVIGLLSMALLVRASSTRAQTDSGTASLNYAFATQLGSGIYRVNERTVQVYRLTFTVQLHHPGDKGWWIRLRFPLTFGFYNFKIHFFR